MHRIIIAPNAFKESLGAAEAAQSIARGVQRVFPRAETILVPMSDGGDGMLQAIAATTGGRMVDYHVTGPLNEPVRSQLFLCQDGRTAVVEMALASGLALVPLEKRNPFDTTTYGTGEMIRLAMDAGCREIIVGIGGSATNDGGAGMAQALGVRLLASDGKEIARGAAGLRHLDRIDLTRMDSRLKETRILVAVDVNNPLCGPTGAAFVYGPQKGAAPESLPELDSILAHFAAIVQRDLGREILHLPGAGAAGGMGGGMVAFLGAELKAGVDLIIQAIGLDQILQQGADLVITGEGEINRQTTHGKVPVGVAQLAKKHNIPVIALVGSIGEGANEVLRSGIDAYFSIISRPLTLNQAKQEADVLLADLAEQVARLWQSLPFVVPTGEAAGHGFPLSLLHYGQALGRFPDPN